MSDSGRDTAPPTNVRWCVSFWLAAVAAIAYLSRTSISLAQDGIRASLSLTEKEMGLVMGPAFYWPYAAAQIPTARLGQRFGSRLMLPLFTAGSSLAVLIFSGAESLLPLMIAWTAMGIGQAGMFPCATQTIGRWHPVTERARASGLLGGSMQAGNVLGLVLAGALIGWLGWRGMFVLFAVPGFAWAMGFARWFRNAPREHPSVNAAELALIGGGAAPPVAASASSKTTPWGVLLCSGTMWLICLQQFFRAGGQVFFNTWFPTYLQESRGVTLQQSAWLTVVPVVTFMFATFIGGGVSDYVLLKTGRLGLARKGVASSALLACAGIIGAAWFVQETIPAVLLISVGMFLAGFAGPCAYASTIDVGGRHVAPVFSTMNMCGNIGAGLMPWVVPYFRETVERLAGGTGDALQTSWAAVLLLFASMFLAAAVCWSRLDIVPDLFDDERPATGQRP